MSTCIYCQAEAHFQCLKPESVEETLACCCTTASVIIDKEPSKRGGPVKDATEMVDPLSTGRKRAVALKPIEEGMECEWKLLAYAGGGVIPIIGCAGGAAKHVHHGPDKDTTNNTDLNLHRVCHPCHNRWHALNDPYYGKRPPAGTPFVPIEGVNRPHDPETQVGLEVVFDHEMWWTKSARNRPKYINAPVGEEENVGDNSDGSSYDDDGLGLPA